MTLSEILKEIKAVEPLAAEDIEAGSPETRNARLGRKSQSVEKLGRLRNSYFHELKNSVLFILVIGDQRNEFTEAATANGKILTADADAYFSKLVDRIPPALYLGKENMANIFDVVSRHIEDMAHDLGIVGYPQLLFKQEYHRSVTNREQFLALIRLAVVNQIGGEIVGIQTLQTLTDIAIERGIASKAIPVILPISNERFALTVAKDLERISSKVFVVTAGQTSDAVKDATPTVAISEVTKEEVKKALKTIEKSAK